MSFCEFLEGIARMADTLGPPSLDELRKFFKFSTTGEGKHERGLLHDYVVNLSRGKTRPLVDKLPQTLALVESTMLDLHAVREPQVEG
jgi:hypothetical protein